MYRRPAETRTKKNPATFRRRGFDGQVMFALNTHRVSPFGKRSGPIPSALRRFEGLASACFFGFFPSGAEGFVKGRF